MNISHDIGRLAAGGSPAIARLDGVSIDRARNIEARSPYAEPAAPGPATGVLISGMRPDATQPPLKPPLGARRKPAHRVQFTVRRADKKVS